MPLVNGKYVPPTYGPQQTQVKPQPKGTPNTQPIASVGNDIQNTPAPLPFMAERLDKFGKAYYGDGFQGWARKTFATLFAPTNYQYNDTEQSKKFYRSEVGLAENVLDKKLNWQSWGEQIFGISTNEAAQALAAPAAAKVQAEEQGKNTTGEMLSSMTGLATRIPGVAWDTFTRVVGVTDHLARKVYSFGQGLEDAKNAAYVTPEEKITNPTANAVVDVITAVNPGSIISNAASVARAIVEKKLTYDDAKQIISDRMAGSAMLYTSLTNETVKNEYLSRLRSGEDPDILAEELQNPWAELVGSIVGDPMTWEGMGVIGDFGKASTALKIPLLGKDIVVGGKTLSVPWRVIGHLPTFGDALAVAGIKIGKARVTDAASRFTKSVVEGFGDDLKLASESPEAQQIVVQAAQRAAESITRYATDYHFTSLDSTGKAATIGRDATHILYNLAGYSKDTEETFQTLAQYHTIFSPTSTQAEKAYAAATLMSHPLGQLLTSEKGIQTGMFIDKLYADGTIQKIIDAAGGDRAKLAENLFKHFDTVLHDTFASIDDLHNASVAAKDVKNAADVKIQGMAKRYAELKKSNSLEVAVRNVTRQIDKVHGPVVGTMGNVYIRYNPAFFAKNIQGQSARIMMDMGIGTGLEIAARAIGTANKDYAEWLLGLHQQSSMDLLGYLHEGLNRGFGNTLGVAESAANRAEGATSGEIIIRTIRDEIGKALNSGAIPQVEADALEKAAPGTRDTLIGLLRKYDGNKDKAFSELRNMFAQGHIKAEQVVEIPPNLRKFLADNHLLDQVLEIQKSGLPRDEMIAKLTEIPVNARAKIEASLAKVPASLGSNAVHEMPVIADAALEAQALHSEGVVPFETADGFTRMTQGWQNAREAMNKMVKTALVQVGGMLDDTGKTQLINDVNQANEVNTSYNRIKTVRDKVRLIYELSKKNATPVKDLALQAEVGDVFNLAKNHPEIDFAAMSTKDFKSLLWNDFYAWSGKDFHAANVADYNTQMHALENATANAGTDLATLLAPKDGQASLFETAEKAMADAEQYQREYFDPNLALQDALAKMPRNVNLQDATIPALARFKGGKEHIFNAVNVERKAKGLEPAATMADVTKDEWVSVLQSRLDVIEEGGAKAPAVMKRIPPPYNGERPSYAMALYKNLDGFEAEYKSFVEGIGKAYGQVLPVDSFTPEAEKALSQFAAAYDSRMAVVRTAAAATATAKRDFLLHSYDKTYLDHALGYLMPFHYWTDRTYVRTMEQLLENPGFMATGAKYKQFIEKQHAGLPDWWKYNVQLPNLPGADPNTPLYMNLQAGLDPMYGLTGQDFNDPYKRADWISKTVDDLNKFGPTFSPLIQWAVGLHLYQDGKVDAGQRWFGRLIPQSTYVKAGLTLAQNAVGQVRKQPAQMANIGPFVQNNEVDPFVNFLDGGLDPYERARVGRALAALQAQGVPEEQLIDAAHSQNGPIWDKAVQLATTWRAPGTLMSAALGVNAKPRTQQDMQTDQMYSELNHLYALSGTISPQDYKKGFQQLREKYPFMDVVLLSKKGGAERDASFAYNVLGRIPPGNTTNMLEVAGLSQEDIDKFYNSKGFTDASVQFTATDKTRFMTAIADMSAIMKTPDDATMQEWNAAKDMDKQVRAEVAQQFGADIWDKIDTYYNLKDTSPDEAATFKEQHPEIDIAQNARRGVVIQTPLLAKYYGGIDAIQMYYDGKNREYLQKKYPGILAKQQMYFDEMDPAKRRAVLSKFPELKKYWDENRALKEQANQQIADFAQYLPEQSDISVRSDFEAQNATQKALVQALQPEQVPSWQELSAPMSLSLQQKVAEYWTQGKPLNKNATAELDYLASKAGFYDGNEYLRYAGIALQSGH
jgi:hypothetical protein